MWLPSEVVLAVRLRGAFLRADPTGCCPGGRAGGSCLRGFSAVGTAGWLSTNFRRNSPRSESDGGGFPPKVCSQVLGWNQDSFRLLDGPGVFASDLFLESTDFSGGCDRHVDGVPCHDRFFGAEIQPTYDSPRILVSKLKIWKLDGNVLMA